MPQLNEYNPVVSGMLEGFSLANILRRAAIEKAAVERSKRGETRENQIRDLELQLRLNELGATEVPSVGKPGPNLVVGGVSLGGSSGAGEEVAPAPAIGTGSLAGDLINTPLLGGRSFRVPTRAQREEEDLNRALKRTEASERARIRIQREAKEAEKVDVGEEITGTLGLPGGVKVPAERLDDIFRAYVAAKNAAVKAGQKKLHNVFHTVDDAGKGHLTYVYDDGTSEMRTTGAVGRRTREPAPKEPKEPKPPPKPESTTQKFQREQQLQQIDEDVGGIERILKRGTDDKGKRLTREQREQLEARRESLGRKKKLLGRQQRELYGEAAAGGISDADVQAGRGYLQKKLGAGK